MKRPPGPKGSLLLGSVAAFRRDTIKFIMETSKNFKGISFFRLGFVKAFLITEPDYIKQVLLTHNKKYIKGTHYHELTHFLGQGLLTSEGSFWLRQRRLAQPSFHKQRIASFAETMVDIANTKIKSWKGKKEIDVANEMMQLTLQVIGKTMLNKDLSEESNTIGKSLTWLIKITNERITHVFNAPMWLPTPANLKFKKELKVVDDLIFTLIAEREKQPENHHNDLLDMLMHTVDEETGEKMSPRQLRDELMTIFIAGHETTAITLTWALCLIGQHPEVENKLCEEIESVLNGRLPDLADVPKLKYTMQVIEETLRLYPPVWTFARKAIEQDIMGGYDIMPGDNIFLSPYATHRSPDYWESPDKFMPERFSEANKENQIKYSYYPFGGGPRFCIGNNFALLEMQLVLAVIFQRYTLRLKKGFIPEAEPLVTLRPKNGIMLMEPTEVKVKATVANT